MSDDFSPERHARRYGLAMGLVAGAMAVRLESDHRRGTQPTESR